MSGFITTDDCDERPLVPRWLRPVSDRETATTAVVRPNLTHTGVKSELRSRGVVYDARDLSAACRHSDGHHVIFQKPCIAD